TRVDGCVTHVDFTRAFNQAGVLEDHGKDDSAVEIEHLVQRKLELLIRADPVLDEYAYRGNRNVRAEAHGAQNPDGISAEESGEPINIAAVYRLHAAVDHLDQVARRGRFGHSQ